MPIYLCKPGRGAEEPWRHGVQVYASPFPLNEYLIPSSVQNRATHTNTTVVDEESEDEIISPPSHPTSSTTTDLVHHPHSSSSTAPDSNNTISDDRTIRHRNTSRSVVSITQQQGGHPIRRIRHAEIVLVDQVSICFGRYWFRLRWPGPRGGVAGFIALGLVPLPEKVQEHITSTFQLRDERILKLVHSASSSSNEIVNNPEIHDRHTADEINHHPRVEPSSQQDLLLNRQGDEEDDEEEEEEEDVDECIDPSTNQDPHDTETDEEEEEEEGPDVPRSRTGSIPSKPSYTLLPICSSSGLYFPTSPAMELLLAYDDGLSHPMTGEDSDLSRGGDGGEPVFCRICREGLHDVNYDTAAIESIPEEGMAPSSSSQAIRLKTNNTTPSYDVDESDVKTEGKNLVVNHPYAENPLLAPCECSGSMAFVHYLCVEQWRCRSDHPTAKNGLCCETCGSAYLLPPPPSRPSAHGGAEDEFLQAIPPHVIQALRRPHFFWKVGAAVVRRKWLRVVTPVLVSPLVSLYCRARRMLKKRGVSRRRWACSLCRRRARWKCVRCLRSYYCSRQCQNVSWHIVHKHVCYKPVRFWWSVVVYGAGTFLLVPGILKHPVIYDWGLSMLTFSFIIMAILGGGCAVAVKRLLKVDIRGRGLEIGVVLSTLWLTRISWGLVWAYFGDNSMCRGYMTKLFPFKEGSMAIFYPAVMLLRILLFRPGKSLIYFVDKMLLNSRPFLRHFLCAEMNTCALFSDAQSCVLQNPTCFRTTQAVNPDFYRPEYAGSSKCAADMDTVLFFWFLAAIIVLAGLFSNRRERQRRLLARERLHND